MKEKRIVAFLIDYFIGIFIVTFLALLIVFSQQIINNPERQFMLAIIILPFILIGEVYLILRDLICGGQSIGKRIVKIKIADKNNGKVGAVRLLLYDITVLIWPIEAIVLLINGWTIGEKLAKVQISEV